MGILCSVKRFRFCDIVTIVLGRKLLRKARGCLNNGDTFVVGVSAPMTRRRSTGIASQLSRCGVWAQKSD